MLGQGVRLIGQGMRSQWRLYLVAMPLAAVFGVLGVVLSRYLGWVTDAVVVPALSGSSDARSRIWAAGAVLAAIAIGTGASVALRRIAGGYAWANLQRDHRRALARQFLRLPVAWHRRHSAGQLLAHAGSDVEAATGVFNPLPFAVGVLVMLVVAVVSLLQLDGWIALTALAVLPATAIVNAVYQRRMTPRVTRAQQERGRLSEVAHESFEGALVVKSLGTADREVRRFAEASERLRGANVRAGAVAAVFNPIIEVLPSLGTLLVLVVGAQRVSAGAVDTGDVVSAAYLLMLLAMPVRALGWVLGELPRAVVGHGRIATVLTARDRIEPGHRLLPASDVDGPARGLELRLEGVGHLVPSASRGGGPEPAHRLLSDVGFTVPAGGTVALVGPTGSGKTTLLGMVVRLSDPTTGSVLLGGVDVRDLRPDELARHVAYVAQGTFVFEDTIRANVTLADRDEPGAPGDDEVWDALRSAQVDEVVARLPQGLDTPLGERGANLSGGQRQRLAIARALVRRPRLLVLDDATSAVDPRVEQRILAGLRRQHGDASGGHRPTVLMSASRLSSIALADSVVHLRGGRVVGQGSHAELMAHDPAYRSLVTAYARRASEVEADAAATVRPEGRW